MGGVTRRGLLKAGSAGFATSLAGTAPAGAQSEPRRGGTISVAITQAPPSLNAQLTSAAASRNINLHMGQNERTVRI